MDIAALPDDSVPASRLEAEALAQRRRQRTLTALADADAGRLISDEAMQAWADSLGTGLELPVPQPG